MEDLLTEITLNLLSDYKSIHASPPWTGMSTAFHGEVIL